MQRAICSDLLFSTYDVCALSEAETDVHKIALGNGDGEKNRCA